MKTLGYLITQKKNQGFAPIELIVVIGILVVLLVITLIAINPSKRFAQINNIARRSDTKDILNAINEYMAKNNGQLPPGLAPGTQLTIAETPATTGETEKNFCTALVPEYITTLPVDPVTGMFIDCTNYDTGYIALISAAKAGQTTRVTIIAPDAELDTIIQVTR